MTNMAGLTKELVKNKARNRAIILPPTLREFREQITGFKPNFPQKSIADSQARNMALVCHRRMGKTYVAVNRLIERARVCPFPDGNYAYVGPTRKQAKDIAWVYIKNLTRNYPGREDPMESELSVRFPTSVEPKTVTVGAYASAKTGWSTIKLWGTNNEAVRGSYFDGVVLDEFAAIRPSVWASEVRPALSDGTRRGKDVEGFWNQWAVIAGTIAETEGKHLLNIYDAAEASMKGLPFVLKDRNGGTVMIQPGEDWFAAWLPASKTGVIPRAELKKAKQDMILALGIEAGESAYRREFELDRDAALPGSIFGRDIAALRAKGRITSVPFDPSLPVHTAVDLGHDDDMVIIFFQTRGAHVRIIDHWSATGSDIPGVLRLLHEKQRDLGYYYGTNYYPHDVNVHDLGIGKTRKAILQEGGLRVTAVPRCQAKADSIAAAHRLLPQCWFDKERCADLLNSLTTYRRQVDESTGKHSEKPVHDGAADDADAFQQIALGMAHAHPSLGLGDGGPSTKYVGAVTSSSRVPRTRRG